MEWLEKAADGGIEEAATLVDVIALETLVEEMVPELSIDEQSDMAHALKQATIRNKMTIEELRNVNAFVADKYLTKQSDQLKASLKPVAHSIVVGDRVFAKSANEFGKVTRVVEAGAAGFESAERVYEAKYGLQHARKGAGALYQVAHDDGGVDLYYDTEIEAAPVALKPLATTKKTAEPVTPEQIAAIDWKPLEDEISKQIGTAITLNVSLDDRGRLTMTSNEDLADKSGVFSSVMKTARITNFGGGVTGSGDGLWVPVNLSYENKSGGSNGQSLLRANYTFASQSWTFLDAAW